MIEELAEQCEPGIERSRQTLVGRNVGEVDVGAVQLDAVGGRATRKARRGRRRSIQNALCGGEGCCSVGGRCLQCRIVRAGCCCCCCCCLNALGIGHGL